MQLKCLLAAFDFDHTIINDNCDIVVKKLLGEDVPEFLDEVLFNDGWTRYMDEIFKLLYERNISQDEIIKAVVSIPPVENSVEMLLTLQQMDCDVIILSDANSVFINEWLSAHSVKCCVNKIYTNPAEFRNGRLHIQGYHQQDWCRISAKNICKGYLLYEYITDCENNGTLFRYLSYCGDGQNDLCPTLRLRAEDYVFPRHKFCLEKLIKKTTKVKANVVPWDNTATIIDSLIDLHLKFKRK